MKPVQRSVRPARSTIRCASSWRRPTMRGRRPSAHPRRTPRSRARRGGVGSRHRRSPRARPPLRRSHPNGEQYACVMHIDGRARCQASCALRHSVGASALARSVDASSPPPAARRRPSLPHRRRHRDDADLPATASSCPCFAAFDLLERRRRPRRRCAPTSRPTSSSPASTGAGFVLDTADLARQPRLGRAARLHARRARRGQPRRGRARRGDPRRRPGARRADRDQRRDRPARRRLRPRRADVAPTRPRATTRGRSRPSPTARADMVTALTMTNAEEAIGIARAAARARHARWSSPSPSRPTGACPTASRSATRSSAVDAETGGSVAYFMINCAHPTPLRRRPRGRRRVARAHPRPARQRVGQEPRRARRGRGARRRRSRRARRPSTARCAARLGSVTVLGGCCGTDHRHVEAIGRAWAD